MLFEKKAPLNLLACPSCKSGGLVGFKQCSACRGRAVGFWQRGKWLFWSFPVNRYNLSLFKGRRIFNKIRKIILVVLWLNAWLWCGFLLWRYLNVNGSVGFNPASWFFDREAVLFWLGAIFLGYFVSRVIREKKIRGRVEPFDYEREAREGGRQKEEIELAGWPKKRLPAKLCRDISLAFTEEAMAAIAEAYELADRDGSSSVSAEHVFCALLSFNRIANIFIRLGLPVRVVKDFLLPVLENKKIAAKKSLGSMPVLSADAWQTLFQAYEEAYSAHQDYVSVTELLVASVQQSPVLQEALYDLKIEKNKLANVVEWARIRERLYRQYVAHSRVAGRRSKKGMDKAMTALATPYLNRFSEDMTLDAQLGRLDFCVARDKEIEEIFRVVEGGGQNILIVGESGVGKKSVVEGLADRMAGDDVPQRLKDKRLVRLSVSALLAGASPAGAIERLRDLLNEILRARNVILFIHNIHELVGVSAGQASGSLDLSDTLSEYVTSGRLLTVATTTPEEYARHISGSPLGNSFAKVEVKEMNENQAIQVVESKIGLIEHKNKVFFSYDAIEKAVQFASRYLHDICLPGSALDVVSETAAYTREKKGADSLVTADEVSKVISDKTGIPVTTVQSDESEKLLRLEEELHKRIIGQDEAVDLVANALRRARAQIRTSNRPIANFLFLGPTGVGKTELAKTIAGVYFGGEDRMVRLDMSEYQDKTSIYRLIGSPGEKGTGILTEAVRRRPFALLLLDEIEKADPDILNLFLQVMDDGRLTDSAGRVADFTNVIIIATSNAATSYVQDQLRVGVSPEAIKERLLRGELKEYFRPEFLNRFDGIVLFKSLAPADIRKIAGLMLKRLVKDLEEKGIELTIDDAALDFLAQVGFDPEFGARPMRRAIQERVENKLAKLLLSGDLKRRDKITLGKNGELNAS